MMNKHFIFLAGLLFSIQLAVGQKPHATFYLRGPQYLFPTSDFGYTKSFSGEKETLSAGGLGVGLGTMIYFIEDSATSFVNAGIDITFADFNLVFNELYANNFSESGEIVSLTNGFFGIGLGPVVNFRLAEKTYIELFAQGYFTIGINEAYGDEGRYSSSNPETHIRLNSGVNLGYDKYFLTVAFNYGNPSFKEINSQERVTKYEVNSAYFKVALTIKFSPLD